MTTQTEYSKFIVAKGMAAAGIILIVWGDSEGSQWTQTIRML